MFFGGSIFAVGAEGGEKSVSKWEDLGRLNDGALKDSGGQAAKVGLRLKIKNAVAA